MAYPTGPTSARPSAARPLTDLDFRSAIRIEEINKLIQELGKYEARDYGDQLALEVHSAKDFIFSMLGLVQKEDHRLPITNEYLLLSGGAREGALDMDPYNLGDYAWGPDYDLDFTLLVPALKLHDRNQPIALDMRNCDAGHTWLNLHLFDSDTLARWGELCCATDTMTDAESGLYFSPTKVANWFFSMVATVIEETRNNPRRGLPRVERVERNGSITTLLLTAGTCRVLYDLVPVVSFRGWPAVAQAWPTWSHFWDGKVTEEAAIGGFYLLPACSRGGRGDEEREWRLCFSRTEVQLKKCIPAPLLQAFQACKAVLRLLSQPRALGPYHLWTLMLWACDRLPISFLWQEENAAHFFLGLLDELLHCLINRSCPNYFLPHCNLLKHVQDTMVLLLARKLSGARAEPAEHLQTAVEQAKAAVKLGQGKAGQATEEGEGEEEKSRLAEKIQQLVTENQGKSISVYLNPEDVSKPHFRVNQKFF
ncbi:transmembrane protein 102 [Microcaecilia unicolor]|uniref:Transmembrane protein 102 n=1 Tax=Microcaecilia unicolor TaxID=1415580 RepID=A0A6P7WWZ3_9AMPH|nr:transmembrane protein 102 [Microcaecilia unicolor]XP_030042776.1 transmembrane protein 102 [Microcaecilia unicolor]XP_030042777.1 transmembrane protein 102 [Microcaecilia unicolor]